VYALPGVTSIIFKLTNNVIDRARVTEPEAFVLDIFFNAHPIFSDPTKQKQKATNVLVPTSIAYAGGYADFPVDMGTEVRLPVLILCQSHISHSTTNLRLHLVS
jgi:hypothetical protein